MEIYDINTIYSKYKEFIDSNCTDLKDGKHSVNHVANFVRLYKIFCVNGNTGFRNESRIFYFIDLQNEEDYERKESSSAR